MPIHIPWDNLNDDSITILARLGRFYALVRLIQNHIINHKILGDSSFSNYHTVSFLINTNDNLVFGFSWNANARFHKANDPINIS